MIKLLSAALAAICVTLFFTGMAKAAPTDVTVRIEGANATLFDRVVRTDGHDVKGAGETIARKCDSTNLAAHELPGPTPTAASVDAMTILGEDFGASWYDGFEDYFIERWGPEAESDKNGWWWGILVNREFTSVGGCQYQLAAGDEVLWVLEAFNGRPMLSLDGPDTAVVGQPIEVEVTDFAGQAYAGSKVSGLTAAVEPVSPEVTVPGVSNAGGTASVTFTRPGWKRLKAYDPADDAELIADAVPSNAIDICVERIAGSGCTGIAPSQNPARVGQDPAVEIVEPVTDPDPDPEPACETDSSRCPAPEPTCETDRKLCPGPDPRAASKVRLGKLELGSRRVRRGGTAKVAVTARNSGDAASGPVEVCLRAIGGGVKNPCRPVGSLAPGTDGRLTYTVSAPRSARPGRRITLRIAVMEGGSKKVARRVRLGVTRR